ncbi:MAG: hypothetical protein RL033_1058, partial [Pseudomonadota bacterium]
MISGILQMKTGISRRSWLLVPLLLPVLLWQAAACREQNAHERATGEALPGGATETGVPNREGQPGTPLGSPSANGESPLGAVPLSGAGGQPSVAPATTLEPSPRSRVSLNDRWRFVKGDAPGTSGLSYADARAWVLPTGNDFKRDPAERLARPAGNLGDGVPYLATDFDDSGWQGVDLPHDYAIEGPYTNDISSSMGRLPSTGVAWYRKAVFVEEASAGKSFFLDLDGAMSFSMVWVNGQFAGGWPSGYASYRLDVSSLLRPGQLNTIAIRLDNPVPTDSNWQNGWSRWYPGAGLYRNVWLVATDPVHVAQWGTQLTTPEISPAAATLRLDVTVKNDSAESVTTTVATDIYELDAAGERVGAPVASLAAVQLSIPAGTAGTAHTS